MDSKITTVALVFKKGIVLGVTSALCATMVECLYMLSPETYVPTDYPILLLLFNMVCWISAGLLSALMLLLVVGKNEAYGTRQNFFWTLFFIFPWIMIYGLVGTEFLSGAKPFDQYLSFLWVALVLAGLVIYFRKKQNNIVSCSFILEMSIIIAGYHFCLNLFAMGGQFKLPLLIAYPLPVYIGVISVLTCSYILLVSRLRRKTTSSRTAILLLVVLVICFESACFFINKYQYLNDISSPVDAHPSMSSSRPSVIFIVLDTVRADRLSVYGDHETTPHLQDFARDALVFDHCVASSHWTLPSHSSMFTGLYPSVHGSHGDLTRKWFGGIPFPRPLDERFDTLAEIFKKHGYKTSAISSNYIFMGRFFNLDQGFDRYDAVRNIGYVFNFPIKPLLHVMSKYLNVLTKYAKPYRDAEIINNLVFDRLELMNHEPSFLFINYMDAHSPNQPPRPFSTHFTEDPYPELFRYRKYVNKVLERKISYNVTAHKKAQYDGELAWMDRNLGTLFARLKKLGLYDDMLIIITSDHGELLGEHGFFGHGNAKRIKPYEGVLHVPLLVKFPGNEKKGHHDQRISIVDIYTNLLTFCRLPAPGFVESQQAKKTTGNFSSENYNFQDGKQSALYVQQYKLLSFEKTSTGELYNLVEDPLEEHNLAEQLPAELRRMQDQHQRWEKNHARFIPAVEESEKKHLHRETEADHEELIMDLKALGYVN